VQVLKCGSDRLVPFAFGDTLLNFCPVAGFPVDVGFGRCLTGGGGDFRTLGGYVTHCCSF